MASVRPRIRRATLSRPLPTRARHHSRDRDLAAPDRGMRARAGSGSARQCAALAAGRGFAAARRSLDPVLGPEVRVVVGDTMGEMLAYYEAADVVIVGGSLLEFGGQNLIEACALGKPVILGPSTYNFEEAAD